MPGTGEQEADRLLRRGLELSGLSLPEGPVAHLRRYCLELEKWNRKVNLIAKNTPLADIVDKHFLDSLTLVPLLDRLQPVGGTFLDVGSGAGFPGLVAKIARPAWKVTLLEPRERRVAFLRHVIRILGLSGIDVQPARTDGGRLAGSYQLITGRAVADIPSFLAMVGELVTAETYVICMQGEAGRQDLQAGDRVGAFVCIDIGSATLPFSKARRFLLVFRREGEPGKGLQPG